MVKIRLSLSVALVTLLLFCSQVVYSQASVSQNPFPVYQCIRDNVAFWKKVYTEYPTTKGLIHDNQDLSLIYEVIDIEPDDHPGARKISKKRIDRAKNKYQEILQSLAKGGEARTEEEKRVLALFGDTPSSARLSEAAGSVRFQQCMKDHFLEGLVRSGSYLAEIKKIFKSYGLPEELAYLPHVESSFNYKAYSKFGAAGIWQFTQSTGKRFMTIDYTMDERRDPIRATHAAARFLKENHQKLGSWPLALTAYNHGPNGMMRAKNKHGSYENIFKHYEGRLFGFASRNFYSEFIAAKEIAENYKKYFGNVKLAAPVSFVEMTMPGYAPIKDLSRHLQVDLATLAELNPALRPPVFEGRKYVPKGYKLRLPAQNGQMLKFASLIPDEVYVDKQKRSRFYQVKRGDSASAIARQHGVRLEDLMAANGLNDRATIYAGQNLRIPTREEKVVMLAKLEAPAEGKNEVKDVSVKKEGGKIVTLKAETVKKEITTRKEEKSASRPEAPAVTSEEIAALVAEKLPEAGKQVVEPGAAQVVAAAEKPAKSEPAASSKVATKEKSTKVEQSAPLVVASAEKPAMQKQAAAPVVAAVKMPAMEKQAGAPVMTAENVPTMEKKMASPVVAAAEKPAKSEPAASPEVATEEMSTKVEKSAPQVMAAAEKPAIKEPVATPVAAPAEEQAVVETTVAEEEQAQLDQAAVIEELPKAPLAEQEFNPEIVTADLLVSDSSTDEKGHTVGFIRVEVGETLGHFADWLQVPTRSIRKLNGLRFGQSIKLGQRLKLEFHRVSKEDFEEKRYEYHKEIEEDFFAVYKIEGARLYRIKSGDNIWSLCQDEFDLPFWLIKKFNAAHDFNNLKLDEQLIIPVVGEIEPQ